MQLFLVYCLCELFVLLLSSDNPNPPKEEQKLFLKSRENDLLEVDEEVAYESRTIQAMSSHLGPKSKPPLRAYMVPLTTKLLKSVLEFCSYQVEMRETANINPAESRKGKWKTWEEQYEKLDLGSICDLLLAANYMDVQPMARMLSRLAASKMPKGAKAAASNDGRKSVVSNDRKGDSRSKLKVRSVGSTS